MSYKVSYSSFLKTNDVDDRVEPFVSDDWCHVKFFDNLIQICIHIILHQVKNLCQNFVHEYSQGYISCRLILTKIIIIRINEKVFQEDDKG